MDLNITSNMITEYVLYGALIIMIISIFKDATRSRGSASIGEIIFKLIFLIAIIYGIYKI